MVDNNKEEQSEEEWEESFCSVLRHLENKQELVEDARKLVERLNADKLSGGPVITVTVIDEKDRNIDIRVISDDITPCMVQLAELGTGNDRIEYPFEGDKYYLKKKVRYV